MGIDGAFVKAKRSAVGQRRQFEILTGRIERERGRGELFGIVRDLDRRAKQKVQFWRHSNGEISRIVVRLDVDTGACVFLEQTFSWSWLLVGQSSKTRNVP